MAIFFPPTPAVVTGGAQPYGQRPIAPFLPANVINNPPFGSPATIVEFQIVAQSQPNPWVYTYFGSSQPFQPKTLNPQITNVPANNPPFAVGGPYVEIFEIASVNQPDPWTYKFMGGFQPFQPHFATSLIPPAHFPPTKDGGINTAQYEVASVNQPNPWVYTYFGNFQPFQPKTLNPQITAVQVDNPPFNYGGPFSNMSLEVAIGQPNPWTWTFMGGAQPFDHQRSNPAWTAVRVDTPPFDRRHFEINAELVQQNQPTVWPYVFTGGPGPYMVKRPIVGNLIVIYSSFKAYIIS